MQRAVTTEYGRHVMQTSLFVYPWDLADYGIGQCLDLIASLGIVRMHLAFTCHCSPERLRGARLPLPLPRLEPYLEMRRKVVNELIRGIRERLHGRTGLWCGSMLGSGVEPDKVSRYLLRTEVFGP